MKRLITGILLLCLIAPATAQTVEWWDFEDGTNGATFYSMPPLYDTHRGSEGLVSSIVLRGYSNTAGPSFSAETHSGVGLSAYTTSSQDGYVSDSRLTTWSPLEWTIEVSFRIDSTLSGTFRTIIGRDGWSEVDGVRFGSGATFYFQRRGSSSGNNQLRLDFATATGQRYECLADFVPEVGKWYHAALVSDGLQVRMYVDMLDGNGYQLLQSVDMDPNNDNRLLIPNNGSGGVWTFGRGWWDGGAADNMAGYFDDVRFTAAALKPAEFIHGFGAAWNPTPANGQMGYGYTPDGQSITAELSWNTGMDPNNSEIVNPDILMHYVYKSKDQNTSDDPNLYPIADIPVTGPVGELVLEDLDYDQVYLWRVDQGIDDGSGNPYPKGDPNNLSGGVWRFGTLLKVPVITKQPTSHFVDAGQTVVFETIADSVSPAQYQWYKSYDAEIDPENDLPVGQPVLYGTLELSQVGIEDEAYYYCQVVNDAGQDAAVYSDVVSLGIRRLVAHWTLDEADYVDGQYRDISGEGHHADPNGTPTFVDGQLGEGFYISRFSGSQPTTQSWARAGTWNPSEFSEQLTVTFWLNWDGVNGSYQSFVSKRSGDWGNSTTLWQISTNHNNTRLHMESPRTNVGVDGLLADTEGQWNHVAVTFDGTDAAVYFNGERRTVGAFQFGDAVDSLISIGGNSFDNNPREWMNGALDDVKIYNYARTTEQIALDYLDIRGDWVCNRELPELRFDFSGDCRVGIADLAVFVEQWLQSNRIYLEP